MKNVAPLRYDVIFKKAFCDPEIFTAFIHDVLGITIEIEKVETEKTFTPPIGRVASRFDLFAQDLKNRVIVDIQHVRYADHYSFPEKFHTTFFSARMGQNFSGDLYDSFLHYHCAAILDQVINSENYRPTLAVYSVVVLTSGDKHKKDSLLIDFDPKDWDGKGIGEIPHKVLYLCPKYVNDRTPEPLRQWLRAIDDTLDQRVEENDYQHPQIRRVFDLIESDRILPEERAIMFEEYNRQQLRDEARQEEKAAIARSLLAQGIDISVIATATGLSAQAIMALPEASLIID